MKPRQDFCMKVILAAVLAISLIIPSVVFADETLVPSWIKNIAMLWSKNKIQDSDFVKAIQYLIEQGIIKVPQIQTTNSQSNIPSWIKATAGWWSDGMITDNDFVNAIQYLVQVNIIKINQGQSILLTSNAFENNGTIPRQYTCDGNNTSPQLSISNVPQNAKSLVLIVDDPDVKPRTFVHWVVWNIPTNTTEISEDEKKMFPLGLNGRGTPEYIGPCPPSGEHHYYFKLYALDYNLEFQGPPAKQDVENGMTGHIIAQSTLLGKYSRG